MLLALLSLVLARPVAAESLVAAPGTMDLPVVGQPAPGPASLDDMLALPFRPQWPTPAEATDESLAEAVARGSEPGRVKQSGFRKKKLDLFRAERPVEIGEQEMLLRLRLRAKTKEAVSVELRF